MDFGSELRARRTNLGLTQRDLADTSDVARPNVVAYETGRREPRWSTAIKLLSAVNTSIRLDQPVQWRWTKARRPHAIPSHLWRLPNHRAFATISLPTYLWWSGPDRTVNLALPKERRRAYEIVLREGRPEDIEAIIDGALLIDAFDDLVLPRDLRRAWSDVITTELEQPSSSADRRP